MKWFFIVLLTQTQGDLHEGFLWVDPSFENKEQCIAWVENNSTKIPNTLDYYYAQWQIHDTLCVRGDRLEDMNVQPYPEGTTI